MNGLKGLWQDRSPGGGRDFLIWLMIFLPVATTALACDIIEKKKQEPQCLTTCEDFNSLLDRQLKLSRRMDNLESMSTAHALMILDHYHPNCIFSHLDGPIPRVFLVLKCEKIEDEYPDARSIYVQVIRSPVGSNWTWHVKSVEY